MLTRRITGHVEHAISRTAQRAWAYVVFNASSGTPTPVASYNLSSITDNGVGDFTLNWVNGFRTANAPYISMARSNTAGGPSTTGIKEGTTPTAAAVNITTALDTASHTVEDVLRGGMYGFSDY